MTNQEIQKEIDGIIDTTNDKLKTWMDTLKQKVANEGKPDRRVIDRSAEIKPCPTTEHAPPMTEVEKQVAKSVVDAISDEIRKNPEDYGSKKQTGDYTGGSKDVGGFSHEVKLVGVGEPKWITDIKKSIANVFIKKKRKKYLDEERLARGLIGRKKTKERTKDNYLYVLLDVSGSMYFYTYKGISLLRLMASYIPKIAKKYSGMWVQVDGDVVITQELSKLSTGSINALTLGGGSGANYGTAVNWVNDDIKKRKFKNPPTVFLFTDMDEDFNFDLMDNLIIVTTNASLPLMAHNGLRERGFPDASRGQKLISIHID